MASAMGLLQVLPVHTKSTRFMIPPGSVGEAKIRDCRFSHFAFRIDVSIPGGRCEQDQQ
jgi:hypothetical protein